MISCDSSLPDAQPDAAPVCESSGPVKKEVGDDTIPVSDVLVSDRNVKAEGSAPLSEPPVTQDVSGIVKSDPDRDPVSKTLDVSGDLKIESDKIWLLITGLTMSPLTIPLLLQSSTQRMSRWSTILVEHHSRLRFPRCRLFP